ncbi:hypothetical protein SERLA73DRAFT_126664 [Serpula lacrymans var. lacrymans S7.3]|uniref:Uncharacterized protein n=1 Tax=Serpula lacrymans var. lacrymans (strain S7.3) TaxID=936435 RepID=F8QEA2_SERL3|nr:hypothetical protein SERLA73DRAFT_126664 [Serpula lacrymans var. lacrymans S7.3]
MRTLLVAERGEHAVLLVRFPWTSLNTLLLAFTPSALAKTGILVCGWEMRDTNH